jgi:hypothetical protein
MEMEALKISLEEKEGCLEDITKEKDDIIEKERHE